MKLIHSDQTGFIKWRHIIQNIRLLDDILQYTDIKKITRNPNNKQKTGKRESSNGRTRRSCTNLKRDELVKWMVYWLSSNKAHDKQQKHFRELCSVPRTKKYLPGRQHSNSSHGEGKVKLLTVNSTREIVLDLHQVLFVPKLTKNLYFQVIWKWICVLYSDAESAFLNRGHLTNFFKVSRGIWRG